MFLNLSNHPVATWPPAKLEAARGLGLGPPTDLVGGFPLVEPVMSTDDVWALAEAIVRRASSMGARGAFVAGDSTLSFAIVTLLLERGVRCFAAAAERRSRERQTDDGVLRESTFDFVQLREYAPSRPAPTTHTVPFPMRVLHARFVATARTRLPPLVTTSLHGALGHALKELACLQPREPCESCTCRGACGYAELFEGPEPTEAVAGLGVTSRAPPSMILAPTEPVTTATSRVLHAGDSFGVEVVLVGGRAVAQASLTVAALRAAGRRGIGADSEARTPLALDAVDWTAPDLAQPARTAVLTTRTPLRLVESGHVRGQLHADLLWRSALRRLDVLWRLHSPAAAAGHRIGLELPAGLSREEAPFTVARSATRVLGLRRHSSRQDRAMDLPGVVGEMHLTGDGLELAWPWLTWAGLLGIGKASSLGFGRYDLQPA